MAGIGETLSVERRRQGRTLADAAAETRVRESYLAALESEDFDILGGDVYARGFIRLYGKYLSLDAEALVQEYRDNHERPAAVTAIPGATIDEIMPARGGGLAQMLNTPIFAAVTVVMAVVVMFLIFRGGGDETAEIDPNAPGPVPAETPLASDDADGDAAVLPSPGAPTAPVPEASPAAAGGIGVMNEIVVTVEATGEVRLNVLQGQPPLDLALSSGDSREVAPDGDRVVFSVSDFGTATISVNGGVLNAPQFAGSAVQITCIVGESECGAEEL